GRGRRLRRHGTVPDRHDRRVQRPDRCHGSQVKECFGHARDAEIYRYQPGLGPVLTARALGEFGDDQHRYADAKSRKNYASTSPTPGASGKKKPVLARYIRNHRLADALHQQAFSALTASPGALAYYNQLRARGQGHHAALRQLANRLVDILHGRLKTGPTYDEHTAWAHHQDRQRGVPLKPWRLRLW